MALSVLVPIAAISTLQMIVIGFVVVVPILTMAFSLYTVLFPEQTAADRLEALTAASAEDEDEITSLTRNSEATPFEQIAARLGGLAQGAPSDKVDEAALETRRMLKQAGYRNRRAFEILNGVRVMCTLIFPVVASPTALFMETSAAAMVMVVSAAVGYYGPGVYVRNVADNRRGQLLDAFPDALDLLVSSVDSGLALDQAFRRVALELQTVAPVLAREFSIVNNEVTAGVPRATALLHLEERTGLEEIRSLVNTINQAERYGSSIADSLRLYSSVAREQRMSRAEERAGSVGSKLTIVMIVFFLPVLMLILAFPSVIRVFEWE